MNPETTTRTTATRGAARFLKNWCSEGLLQRDPDPALYVYHQTFDHGGQELNRRGFMARIRLERFGEGKIYPHEETHAAAKADRFKLTVACKANLSQIFGLYPDEENAAQEILERAVRGHDPARSRRPPGRDPSHVAGQRRQGHRRSRRPSWAPSRCSSPTGITGMKPPATTAITCRAASRCPPAHPANFVLGMCVSMSDPGMVVLPTHRLFRGLPAPVLRATGREARRLLPDQRRGPGS